METTDLDTFFLWQHEEGKLLCYFNIVKSPSPCGKVIRVYLGNKVNDDEGFLLCVEIKKNKEDECCETLWLTCEKDTYEAHVPFFKQCGVWVEISNEDNRKQQRAVKSEHVSRKKRKSKTKERTYSKHAKKIGLAGVLVPALGWMGWYFWRGMVQSDKPGG